MQRMYEEKRLQMERGSIGGSYFMVQLPDGTMEKRMKMPINIDPGVHSSLNLDQLAAQSGGLHPVATLPTISETKSNENESGSPEETPNQSQSDTRKRPPRPHRNSESDSVIEFGTKNIPRNASQPAFTAHHQGKNISVSNSKMYFVHFLCFFFFVFHRQAFRKTVQCQHLIEFVRHRQVNVSNHH